MHARNDFVHFSSINEYHNGGGTERTRTIRGNRRLNTMRCPRASIVLPRPFYASFLIRIDQPVIDRAHHVAKKRHCGQFERVCGVANTSDESLVPAVLHAVQRAASSRYSPVLTTVKPKYPTDRAIQRCMTYQREIFVFQLLKQGFVAYPVRFAEQFTKLKERLPMRGTEWPQ